MLDLLAASRPARFTALDLGSGPGSLSARLLARFPRAHCVAVDQDPVVQRIGEGAHGTFGGRLAWVRADLGTADWVRALPVRKFDAAVSTTALHWLDRPRLARLYRDLGRLLPPGGVFLNGDRMPWGKDRPDLARLAGKLREVRQRRAGRVPGWGVWEAWWEAARRDPELAPLFLERQARAGHHPRSGDLALSVHVRALRRAGFRTADVLWRDGEDGILFARR
jgi:SAM-dependent methyltransferase